jgi:hypothetical protein
MTGVTLRVDVPEAQQPRRSDMPCTIEGIASRLE